MTDISIDLIHANSLEYLKSLPNESVDLIFADPPYFLSNDGISCSNGEMVSVNKGEWDKESEDLPMDDFNEIFLKECQRIVKNTGSVWVSGTFHNIFSLGRTLQQLNYKILNNIIWEKTNPAPNLSCRMFTHSTETIIWARKSEKAKHYYNYELMKMENNNKQMKDVWRFPTTPRREKKFGKHPTQKPLDLLTRIIQASSKEGDTILDPFMGSGTTGVACAMLNRHFIGIDFEQEYVELAERRIEDVLNNHQQSLF